MKPRRVYLWTVLFLVSVIAALVFAPVSPGPDLDAAPDESRRAAHPDGYSIIVPRNTRAIVSDFDGSIRLTSASGRSRLYPAISVRRLDDEGLQRERKNWVYKPGTFQGQPAEIYVGPSGKYCVSHALFERQGQWFVVSLLLPGEFSDDVVMPPPPWAPYLESFRFSRPTSATPSTQRGS